MKHLAKLLLGLTIVAALVAAPMQRTFAQDTPAAGLKPAVIVSLSSVEEIMGDIGYLSKVAGAEDMGQLLVLMTSGYTAGLDKQRPAGGYVSLANGTPEGLVFLPVKDLSILLESLKPQIGEPKDVGNGVSQIGAAPPVFIKEQDGWVFVGQTPDALQNLPKDPAALLNGLDKEYDIAVQVMVQNIPKPFRDLAVTQMKMAFELQNAELQKQAKGAGDENLDQELAEKLGRNSIQQLVTLIEETDQFTIGLSIDSEKKDVHLDISMTAAAGSNLARRMDLIKNAKSNYSGFLSSDAAFSLHFINNMAKEDIDQMLTIFSVMREKALEELEKDEDLPEGDARDEAKKILGTLLDVLKATVEGGTLNGGASLVLEKNEVNFAAGFLVVNGAELENAFKRLVEIAKNEPDFPKVEFDIATHQGIRFHSMTAPIPESEKEARELLGDQFELVLGFSDDSIYAAFGKDSLKTIKEIIDHSKADADKVLPPTELIVSVGAIVKFAAAIDNNPMIAAAAASLGESNGKDHIVIRSEAIKGGVRTRIIVEEDVLRLIGEIGKMAAAGGPVGLPGGDAQNEN